MQSIQINCVDYQIYKEPVEYESFINSFNFSIAREMSHENLIQFYRLLYTNIGAEEYNLKSYLQMAVSFKSERDFWLKYQTTGCLIEESPVNCLDKTDEYLEEINLLINEIPLTIRQLVFGKFKLKLLYSFLYAEYDFTYASCLRRVRISKHDIQTSFWELEPASENGFHFKNTVFLEYLAADSGANSYPHDQLLTYTIHLPMRMTFWLIEPVGDNWDKIKIQNEVSKHYICEDSNGFIHTTGRSDTAAIFNVIPV